jgi:hypothetical protein
MKGTAQAIDRRTKMADLVTRFPGIVTEEDKIKAEIESFFSTLKNRISRKWEAGYSLEKRVLKNRYDFTSQLPYHSEHV